MKKFFYVVITLILCSVSFAFGMTYAQTTRNTPFYAVYSYTPTPTKTITSTPKPTQKPSPQKQLGSISTYQNLSYTVYITSTGEKYHSDGCQYLRQSQIAIDKNDAIDQGYTPCSKCKP